MTRVLLAALFVVCFAASCARDDAKPISPARLEILDFESDVFANRRKLRVWLPPGYDSGSGRRYPVLYLNDGQSLFDASASVFFDSEWMVDETAGRLIRQDAIEPVIIVGVDHAGREGRPYEYLPFEDIYLSPPVPDPRGGDYPAFLFGEVIPFIETRYNADPERRSLGGSSYGGLIAVYTAIARQGELESLLVESPSLYVDEARVLNMAQDVRLWPERVYLGVGTHEGPKECRDDNRVDEAVDDVRRLEAIVRKNHPESSVMTAVEDCGLHAPDYWAKRLPAALKFLYPPR